MKVTYTITTDEDPALVREMLDNPDGLLEHLAELLTTNPYRVPYKLVFASKRSIVVDPQQPALLSLAPASRNGRPA